MVRCSRSLKGQYVAMSSMFGLTISELGRIALEEYIRRHSDDDTLMVPRRGGSPATKKKALKTETSRG